MGAVEKVGLKDWFQNEQYRCLHNAITDRRYAKRPHLSVCFRYINAFAGDSDAVTMHAITTTNPPALHALRAGISPALEQVVSQALFQIGGSVLVTC